MNAVALRASFYRANPQRFAKDYLNLNLKLFQQILLYLMVRSTGFCFIAARGQIYRPPFYLNEKIGQYR
nr:MAG TPA: Terminase large subunit [Caudoviricetes sp.]